MKAKVIVPFRDKYTNKVYKKGAIVDLPVKRINEIILQGKYLQLVEVEETKTIKS